MKHQHYIWDSKPPDTAVVGVAYQIGSYWSGVELKIIPACHNDNLRA